MSDLRKTVLMKESMDIDSPTRSDLRKTVLMKESMDIDSPTRKSTDTDTDSTGDSTLTTLSEYSSDSSPGSCSPSPNPPRHYHSSIDFQKLSLEEYVKLLLSYYKPPPKVEKNGFRKSEMYAKLVLAYYKEKTGEEYEFSRIRSMTPFPSRPDRYFGGTHLNFFASHEGSEYLLYGELEHSPQVPNSVVDCYVFPIGTDYGMEFTVHPPTVNCPDCNNPGLYEALDSDDEY